MSPIIIAVVAFIGIASLVGAVGAALFASPADKLEDRLDVLTGVKKAASRAENAAQPSVLAKPLDFREPLIERVINRYFNLGLLFEQADTSLSVPQFALISLGLAVSGGAMLVIVGTPLYVAPVLMFVLGGLPLFWLVWRRQSRLKKFGAQLPGALEMLARALRSGQSLPTGFMMAAKELDPPISKEFMRVAEEQNFGISMDDSLEGMAERVPNLDLRFFCTAVILQRQTGGDLAEILDKIGHLIRERFQIWGQVQALTGEGRLSGAILLAMPFALFLIMYYLNPEYTMLLITEPIGRKMLAGTLVMQLLGAIVIKKIVTIKV